MELSLFWLLWRNLFDRMMQNGDRACYRHDETVSTAREGFYEARMIGVVTERLAKFFNCAV